MAADSGCRKSSYSPPVGSLKRLGVTLMSLSLLLFPRIHVLKLRRVGGSMTNETITLPDSASA